LNYFPALILILFI
jgi:hypothetical protein